MSKKAKSAAKSDLHRKHSAAVVDGPERAASRAMLHAVGFKREDFKKNKVGIASTWSMVTPCNMHIDRLAAEAAKGVDAAGGKSVIFNTITISDGISMGTEGMKYSLVSREVIADSIETVVGCEGMDGYVAIGGCDKNMPGCIMAMGRMNRPSVFVYGGTILPGCVGPDKKDADVVTVFEAIGKHANCLITDKELTEIEEHAIPGEGSCGGMYTANTMASAIEALGMSLPNSGAQAAVSNEKMMDCFDAGAAVVNLIKRGITPRDIMTKEAFENAITLIITLGGSTNAVLHLIAAAHSTGIKLGIEDFVRIGKKTPVLADLRPSGKYFMNDLVKIGGTVPLIRLLVNEGIMNGDCLTVTGKTMRENMKNSKIVWPKRSDDRSPAQQSIKKGQPPRHLQRQPLPRWRRRQDHRQGRPQVRRQSHRLRVRRNRAASHPQRQGQEGPRRRRAHGRTQGRPWHARDALTHERHHGQRPRQRRRLHHRRSLQRRQPRLRGRARHA